MTAAYNLYYVLVSLTGVLTVPGVITLVVLAALQEWLSQEQIVFGGGAVLCLLWTAYIRQHSRRVLIRSGAWPNWCNNKDDHIAVPLTSTTETYEKIEEFRSKTKENYGVPPQIVGAGWGYFLQRAGPPGPRLFLHKLKGKTQTKGAYTWYAGTTIADVNKDLQKSGYTLHAHPTMDYISIGSWFAIGNHGNQGDIGKGNDETFESATVMNLDNGKRTKISSYKDLRKAIDFHRELLCLLDVSIKPDSLAGVSTIVQKFAYVINSSSVAHQWLESGAYLRVIFMGAARRNAIGLRWEESDNTKIEHWDPHPCSTFCQFLQVDICSVYGGCFEKMTLFQGQSYLRDANKWMPYVDPFATILVVLSGTYNFEIIFKLQSLDGKRLYELIQAMNTIHFMYGGRSELRFSDLYPNSDYKLVYLDMSLSTKKGFQAPFKMLNSTFGVKEVALHPGKFNRVPTAPCLKVNQYAIMYSREEP